MNQEFETQVLDIDAEEIKNKLRSLGANETSEAFQKRWVFDIDPEKTEWIRLRESGAKSTICYKSKAGGGISETTEIEVGVDNFEKAYAILDVLHFDKKRYYQENKKQKFVFDGIEFEICHFPMIPPVLEIEAKSEIDVHRGLELLGLTGKDAGHIGWKEIYHRYGIDLHSFKELKFEEKK